MPQQSIYFAEACYCFAHMLCISASARVLLARLDLLDLLWEKPGPGGHGCLASVGGAAGEDLLGLRPGWHSGWGGSRGRGGAAGGSAGAHLAADEGLILLLGLGSRQAPRGAEAEVCLVAAGCAETTFATVQPCALSDNGAGGGSSSDVGGDVCPLTAWL